MFSGRIQLKTMDMINNNSNYIFRKNRLYDRREYIPDAALACSGESDSNSK